MRAGASVIYGVVHFFNPDREASLWGFFVFLTVMFWSKDMNILQISYLKLADHKNGKRLWLQGLRLEDAGYEIGSFYSLHYDEVKRQVLLSSSDQGSNKVCRIKVGDHFYPLIDIVNQKLSALFEGVERVQVLFSVDHAGDVQYRLGFENQKKYLLGKPLEFFNLHPNTC